jgi:succinate-semialdehyde dehydrogenase/glutarate-semialdehyde dehydrogenase
MPWNFPYYQVARFAGPNIINGNTILLKHAPQCPESSAAIHQIFVDAGAPEGLYTDVRLTNEQAAEVIADRRVAGVSVTGSERAGAAVAAEAGKNLKKVALELGGSDPFYLFSTDDLDSVVDAAVAGRIDNAGQVCNGTKRFIIVDKYYDEFLEKFTAKMAAVEPGDPTLAETELGPMSSAAAADRIAEQVERAVAQGTETSTHPPSSPASARTWTSMPRNSSVPWRPSSRSPTRTRPSRWVTMWTSASAPTSSRRTQSRPIASPTASRPAWSTSTWSARTRQNCRSVE